MAPAGPAWAFFPKAPCSFLGGLAQPQLRPRQGDDAKHHDVEAALQGGVGSGVLCMLAHLQGGSALAKGVLGTGPKISLVSSSVHHLSVGQAGSREA